MKLEIRLYQVDPHPKLKTIIISEQFEIDDDRIEHFKISLKKSIKILQEP